MTTLQAGTGADANIARDEQIRIALREIVRLGGCAQMNDIYEALKTRLHARPDSGKGELIRSVG